MRLFKRDGPAAQFEAGHQKGDNYPCWGFSIYKGDISNFTHVSSLPLISLNDRVDKVLSSLRSRETCKLKKTKLYSELAFDNVILELHQRGIKFSMKQKKEDIQCIFTQELHGIQRVPALLFDNPTKTLEDIQLYQYEVSTIEPMHDVDNHIKNVYEEAPQHLPSFWKKKTE